MLHISRRFAHFIHISGAMNNVAVPPQTNSPDQSQIGAARVDILSHHISADGVRPNDDRIATFSHMPMPIDTKELCSVLGGLSY